MNSIHTRQRPLDSHQLNAFVTLARTGSFTKTARELFLTHSAISHWIRALEAEVGCRLLTRLSKKIVLTEAGETLLHHVEPAIQELQNAREALKQLNQWGGAGCRLDDSGYLKAFALHPYFSYWQELAGKATDADVPEAVGFVPGFNPAVRSGAEHPSPGSSYYFELGVAPSYTFANVLGGLKLEAPCRVLLPDDRCACRPGPFMRWSGKTGRAKARWSSASWVFIAPMAVTFSSMASRGK